ncbi:MAG: histidine kinase [Opitutaceae bacterium]|jgi:two-component system, OmpR family, phosphate regulon sensor histidine kinase PhoR|nr:histidine kinase [Opitutaceae bacterium]
MLETLIVILVVALIILRGKLVGHRKALRTIKGALEARQPFLRHEHPGASGADWDEFCTAANDLIDEVGALEKTKVSHLAQLDATLGSLNEAVLIVDSHNHIMLANRSLQDIFPEAVDILEQRLEVVLHSVEFLGYVERVRAGEADPRSEIEFVGADDTRWVEVTGTTILALDGSDSKWALFVLHDVTRQKGLERVRKEFVANVSHELRTPLAVIKGYIETLVDDHDTMEAEDRLRFLGTVQRHTERLNSLLDDLLTLSRLESSKPGLNRESLELRPLIEGVLDDYLNRPDTTSQQIESIIDPADVCVWADPLKITQVINNLIENALKYTPSGSTIEIAAALKPTGVEIRISDNGPGIPEADLPHIFERFYRVEKGRSREKGGTGLGLAIVKHIVQLHGGHVEVVSVPGQGASFILLLPVDATVPTRDGA